MNFKLVRNKACLYGIFGELRDESGKPIYVTLEHAYPEGKDFVPKLAQGTYTCVRHPPNRLLYVTFMVEGVPNFQGAKVDGILIHRGNYNKDSEGCILLGCNVLSGCITDSKKAFEHFMDLQAGVDSFILEVA